MKRRGLHLVNRIEAHARLFDQRFLETTDRADECYRCLWIGVQQPLSDRQRRIHVTARSPGCDQ